MACTDDTDSITLSTAGGTLTADLAVAPTLDSIPNLLEVDSDGVRVVGADGWVPLPATVTGGSNTGILWQFVPSIDLTSLVSPGMRVKFTQNGTEHFFSVVEVTASQLFLYTLDGSTVDSSAITFPYFSVGLAPALSLGVGPLLVDTGLEVFPVFWTVEGWVSAPIPVWRCANAAANTRTANTYTNISAGGYSAGRLPFRFMIDNGLTWQFRWVSGVSYGAGQTSAGVRLTAYTGDLAGGASAQDTTNIFGEVTSFTANATVLKDSDWATLNASITEKDVLVIMPQYKSDGTRTVTISQTDVFEVEARLIFP